MKRELVQLSHHTSSRFACCCTCLRGREIGREGGEGGSDLWQSPMPQVWIGDMFAAITAEVSPASSPMLLRSGPSCPGCQRACFHWRKKKGRTSAKCKMCPPRVADSFTYIQVVPNSSIILRVLVENTFWHTPKLRT